MIANHTKRTRKNKNFIRNYFHHPLFSSNPFDMCTLKTCQNCRVIVQSASTQERTKSKLVDSIAHYCTMQNCSNPNYWTGLVEIWWFEGKTQKPGPMGDNLSVYNRQHHQSESILHTVLWLLIEFDLTCLLLEVCMSVITLLF